MDSNLKREIILDNYQEPFHRGLVEDESYSSINSRSDSCIDNFNYMLKIENGIISDIVFDGDGCAISTSASSILIRSLIGKKVEDAKKILQEYLNMISEKKYNQELLGELLVYEDICKQPNRKNCALLPANAIIKLMGDLNRE